MSAGPAALAIEGLWTTFAGGVVVHQNLSLQVPRGELLGLVGGSGTGKTVLLRQVLGLLTPQRGRIVVQGEPVLGSPGPGAAARLGMLFQHGALFSSMSVLDNIAFPLAELATRAGLDAAAVLAAARLRLELVGLPPSAAYKRPADLSGGMVKRVALARALILDPPLLLLDEPTAGLDPDSAEAFCALLHRLHQALDLTVVMVTHDLDTLVDLCTRVAVLAERRVLVHDTLAQVVSMDHPFIRGFFGGARGQRALRR